MSKEIDKIIEALENISIKFDELGFSPTIPIPKGDKAHFIDWFKVEIDTIKVVTKKQAQRIAELESKLAEFEDFMEEQGFESLGDLKDSYETIKKSQASTHSTLMTINKELVKARQIIARHTIENQTLKERWEKLKDYVNTPKEFQEWREEMEITGDSIKAKMQELEE